MHNFARVCKLSALVWQYESFIVSEKSVFCALEAQRPLLNLLMDQIVDLDQFSVWKESCPALLYYLCVETLSCVQKAALL